MKRLTGFFLIACGVVLLFTPFFLRPGFAQLSPAKGSQTNEFHLDSGDLDLDPKVETQAKLAFDSAETSVATLSTSKAEQNGSFKKSTDEAVAVFHEASTRIRSGEKLEKADTDKLSAAAIDLNTKAVWSTHAAAVLTDPTVKVTVNTRAQDGLAVQACEVWYVTAFYQDNPERATTFNQLSSPTSQPLLVGAYVMWTSKAGKKGESRLVRVGTAGEANMTIDLPAPN